MRLLHTGDWHVGRTIRGRSRSDESEQALDLVVSVATDQAVDAVLVSGDIYDHRSVSPETDRLIFETLIRLYDAGIRVVAIPGNHDSAVRLEALGPLLDHVGTTVVAKVLRPNAGGMVALPSRDGTETALIACIPFIPARRFSDAAGVFEDLAAGYVDYDESMGRVLAAFEAAFEIDAVNVVMGHMFVSGAQWSGSEREVTIGSDYAVSPMRLPATASYVALGHIHKPQKVPGAPGEARYCGSLIQLDFGERGQSKSLPVVEVAAGKPPRVTEIEIDAGRRLIDVEATFDELPAVAERVGDAYVRLSLTIDSPVPGIADQVRSALPNALDVRLVLPDAEGSAEDPVSLRVLGPRDQFASYYRAQHSADPPSSIVAAFDRVHEEVTS